MLFLQAFAVLSMSIGSITFAQAPSNPRISSHQGHAAVQEGLRVPSDSWSKDATAIPDDMHTGQDNNGHLIGHSDHEKRAMGRSYAVSFCPAGTSFYQSKCRDIREYRIRCINETTAQALFLRGHCFPDEICADTYSFMDSALPHFNPWRTQAYCIGYHDFALFAKSQLGTDNHIPASQVGLPLGGQGASQYTLEAILTNPDGNSTVKAEKMTLQTMRTRNVHGHLLDVPLRGGAKECSDCDRIFVDPVPDGTTLISLDVVGKAGAFIENIRMGSWVP